MNTYTIDFHFYFDNRKEGYKFLKKLKKEVIDAKFDFHDFRGERGQRWAIVFTLNSLTCAELRSKHDLYMRLYRPYYDGWEGDWCNPEQFMKDYNEPDIN